MHDLTNFDLREMTKCGSALRQSGKNGKSLEEVANSIVRYLYDHLIDGSTDKKACALVRFFKTHNFSDLDEDLKKFARGLLSGQPETPDMKCLTLMATAGEKPEWNSRQTSGGHKAIPLPSTEAVERLPMIVNLIKQLGLDVSQVVKPAPGILLDLEEKQYGVFHVPDAVGSQYIPAQEEFIIPQGIKSVLGFGGLFSTGDMFAVILFSKVSISAQTADLFKTLALGAKVAVLPFEKTVFA